jgi:LDH2 family malate/lactate/ureidoglycolate dehydrogenase/DNA-binding GntR family transcriptional regulator
MRLDKADRVKLSDLAREAIRERIISGAFPMGRKLREADLSDLLGMSKSPIREALLQLESEGLIEMPPDRSAQVFSMGPDEIAQLGELRQILEREALDLAMTRSPAQLAHALGIVIDQMRTAMDAGDTTRYRLLDLDFHTAILDACGNSFLRANYQMLAFRIQALRNWLSLDAELNRISFADHQGLLDAVRAGDSAAARALLHKHISETTANYLSRFASTASDGPADPPRVHLPEIERFCRDALMAIGADDATTGAMVRALSHASRLGVDSHGYRLLPHYLQGLRRGRLNPRPAMRFAAERGGAGVLDADNGHGMLAGYMAVDHAVNAARAHGIGAVSIRNSSHFGAAGAYAMAIADAGMLGMAFCNSDSLVRLHGGAARFHGTNPIAMAAPTDLDRPWLLDMATSSIPYNRVLLFRGLGRDLPSEVAADAEGRFVTDPHLVEMLAPLGGALFGYKGAGLAGLAEILSTALGNAPLSFELPPMVSDEMETPRHLGAFVLAIDPSAFGGAEAFRAVVTRYVTAIRQSSRAGSDPVMAAGDREWQEEARRLRDGILLDPDTITSLNDFAAEQSIPALQLAGTGG